MSQISNFVEAMFSGLPKTEEVVKVRLQITDNMEEKYDALIKEGKNANEALGIVMAEFGTIEELRKELGITEGSQAIAFQKQDERLNILFDEYQRFIPSCNLAVAVAVALFILSAFAADYFSSAMVFFILIAAGVGILIYFLGRKKDYLLLMEQRKAELGILPEKSVTREEKRMEQIYPLVPLSAVFIYLILGFFFELWHPGWIVFLLIPVAFCILNMIRRE